MATINQKTVIMDEYSAPFTPKVGMEVLLVGRTNVLSGYESFFLSAAYAEMGYPGVSDRSVYRFHGWRGTYNDTSYDAYGVRRITKVTKVAKIDGDYYKVTVGKDIHPEWD